MDISITLTEREAEILDNYIFRKICKLKESSLEDAECYVALSNVHRKIKASTHDARIIDIASRIKEIYDEAISNKHEAVKHVDEVEVTVNFDKSQINATLYRCGYKIVDYIFEVKSDKVICLEDGMPVDLTDVKSFFMEDD